MVRPVVVGAVGRERGETVGMLERTHEVVARGLGGGIGRVGREGRLLREGGVRRPKRAVNLVGRHVEETEGGLLRRRQRSPVPSGGVEQAQRADDVGLDERLGRIDGAVDVRLGGEVDHCVDLVFGEQPGHESLVANVALGENVAWIAGEVG